MVQAYMQLHITHANLNLKVFTQLSLLMFLTKLYSYHLLSYVTDLCQLLSFIMSPWMGPLLRNSTSNFSAPPSVSFEGVTKTLTSQIPKKQFW